MTNVSVGIVGLPNVGKSTLFNAVLKKQLALVANYPFATIEPNTGIVEVKDKRVDRLADLTHSAKKIYSTVKFIDIAGLVQGAAGGSGLGNKFLSHIREVDLILFVLRGFKDENVIREGSTAPADDLAILKTELCLKDLETIAKNENAKLKNQNEKEKIETEKTKKILEKIKQSLNNNVMVSEMKLNEEELTRIKHLCLLTAKPYLILINTDEENLGWSREKIKANFGLENDTFLICAKTENELAELADNEKAEYLAALNLKKSPIELAVKAAFDKLFLLQFFTTGPDETRSWTVARGTKAPQAAGVIHTDFENGFIKAEVVSYDEFVKWGSWSVCREKGVLRTEGKEYVFQDGDIAEFKFN